VKSRTWATMVVAAAVMIGGAGPAIGASDPPVRSGTIIDGVFTTGPAGRCTFQADCIAWRASGCSETFADVPVAAHTAVVDVRDRAGSERTLQIERGDGASLIIGGVFVEYWSGFCVKLEPEWRSFYDCVAPTCTAEPVTTGVVRVGRERVTATLQIPPSAAWMTISANDNLNLDWSLS